MTTMPARILPLDTPPDASVRARAGHDCSEKSEELQATTISTHSVSPVFMSLSQHNPVEPPWYVTRLPGGVGGVAPRGVPLSRSSALLAR
jgi:hypothetical protein